MENRTLLVLQGPDGRPQDLSHLADTVTAFNGHMVVVNVGPVPPIPAFEMGAMPYGSIGLPDQWVATQHEVADALAAQFAATQDYLGKAGVSGEANMICDSAHALEHRIVPHTFAADIAVILNDLRSDADAFRSLAYGVILGSPIPLLLNPSPSAISPERVFVAWNTSLPAARALHTALPMLKAAQEITLCIIDPRSGEDRDGEDPGTSIAAWLSHHGCAVTVQQVPSGGAPTSDVILRRASEAGADLIVMGAYGHSRMQQRMFGGTTRSMMEQTAQAVLMAH